MRNLYPPDIAQALNQVGYIVLTFDYKGWGDSEGSRSWLAPYSRVMDSQAALTWLGAQPVVDGEKLGLYDTSYGGANVVWVAAVDPRVKCVVSVVGVGNGRRWMRSVRHPDEYHDLRERSDIDRIKRVTEGQSEFVERSEILLHDRQSAGLATATRRGNPGAVSQIPLEFIDDTLGFHPEWVVDKIAPRPVLFITSNDDRLVRPRRVRRCISVPASPRSLSFSSVLAITRSMPAKPSAKSWHQRSTGSGNTCHHAREASLDASPAGS